MNSSNLIKGYIHVAGAIIMPILQARVLKHRELVWLSRGHTVNNWQSQDVTLRVLVLILTPRAGPLDLLLGCLCLRVSRISQRVF